MSLTLTPKLMSWAAMKMIMSIREARAQEKEKPDRGPLHQECAAGAGSGTCDD